jgi:PAS domain S-box-containing protein
MLVEELRRVNRNLDLALEARAGELLLSEEKYRTLFDHVPDGVLLVSADAGDGYGRIADANEIAARMHGYSLEELKRMNIEELHAPGPTPQLESFEARIWRLQPGETVREELLHRRKDGTCFPVEAIGTVVNLRGRPYMLGFSRDITQRRAAEEALLATQRTESVGLLAGGIAHDFNNLLTAIMGQTFIAMEKLQGGQEGRANLERALNAAEKASILTQQMLAYSGRGKFTIQPIPLNRMIQENQRFLEAAIPKNVHFELDLADGIPPVTGDLGQLQQVIMNLVINGAQAIGPAGGRIRITTSLAHLEEEETRRWSFGANNLPPGPYVLLEVADSGCGMDAETQQRAFDPFFSTKEKGHGLGLSAVLGIVRSHRGGLRLDSEIGAGSTFRIAFPGGEHAAASPAEPPPLDGPNHGGLRVLVVDDEDYMREVVQDILSVNGHTALLAQSGEEGIEIFRRGDAPIDVVLLDLTMPGMDGLETCRILRGIDPGLRVILTSGFSGEEALTRLQELPLAGFLQKPYPAQELIRLLKSLPERS